MDQNDFPSHLRVLIVDDDPVDAEKSARILNKDDDCSYELMAASSGAVGLQRCRSERPDCVLLDLQLPDMEGLKFLAQMNSAGGDSAVVIVSGRGSEEVATSALRAGAQDYLVKNFLNLGVLSRAIHNAVRTKRLQGELETTRRKLGRLAFYDSVTGLGNRNLFEDRLGNALSVAARSGHPVGVLLLDLDGFKAINDEHGHGAGDQVLAEVGRRLSASIRSADTVTRRGGDEFAILLQTSANIEGVTILAKRILDLLSRPIALDGRTLQVGASVGIALYPDHAEHAMALVAFADAAMYRAKRAGGGFMIHDVPNS